MGAFSLQLVQTPFFLASCLLVCPQSRLYSFRPEVSLLVLSYSLESGFVVAGMSGFGWLPPLEGVLAFLSCLRAVVPFSGFDFRRIFPGREKANWKVLPSTRVSGALPQGRDRRLAKDFAMMTMAFPI